MRSLEFATNQAVLEKISALQYPAAEDMNLRADFLNTMRTHMERRIRLLMHINTPLSITEAPCERSIAVMRRCMQMTAVSYKKFADTDIDVSLALLESIAVDLPH